MPSVEPLISIIVCTRNRAAGLEECLARMRSLSWDEHNAELILVDNASTDRTQAVLTQFREAVSFSVVVVSEPACGLSNARNAGLRAARGRIIAFTDDDCYVPDDHLARIKRTFQTADFDFCGGSILPFDQQDAEIAFNIIQEAEEIPPRSFIAAGKIQGANMIFRRELIERVGDFDPMLGAGTGFRCEDIEYCARASHLGFVGARVPDIYVYHHHRRQKHAEVHALTSANERARGAYYMKFVLVGRWDFLWHWIIKIPRRRPLAPLREAWGALDYLRRRAKSK